MHLLCIRLCFLFQFATDIGISLSSQLTAASNNCGGNCLHMNNALYTCISDEAADAVGIYIPVCCVLFQCMATELWSIPVSDSCIHVVFIDCIV